MRAEAGECRCVFLSVELGCSGDAVESCVGYDALRVQQQHDDDVPAGRGRCADGRGMGRVQDCISLSGVIHV